MTIKEVSEKYNISQDTLRYYEKVGIIPFEKIIDFYNKAFKA